MYIVLYMIITCIIISHLKKLKNLKPRIEQFLFLIIQEQEKYYFMISDIPASFTTFEVFTLLRNLGKLKQ